MNLFGPVTAMVNALGARLALLSGFDLVLVVPCVLMLLYAAAQLWMISEREKRLAAFKHVEEQAPSGQSKLDLTVINSPSWYARLGAAIAATVFVGATDRERLARVLADAGLHGGKSRLATLVAAKLGCFALLVSGTWLAMTFFDLLTHYAMFRIIALLASALVGWRIPDIALGRLAKRRRMNIENTIPDALDLLVICAEAGLSFEQGIEFVAREMAPVMREIGEEFAMTSAELRVLGDRREALQNFANRVNLPAVRSIVMTLTQSMRYGTPLAQSLRLLAGEMRRARLLRMEARAARMPVLLTMPLMTFILPSLMMVVAGPAIIKVMDAFGHMSK